MKTKRRIETTGISTKFDTLIKGERMREIKYRYYMQHEDTGMIMSKEYELEEIESYDGVSIPHRYFTFKRCQYTGLKDKNGTEIYEGDILTHKMQGNRFVDFGSPLASYAGYMLVSSDGMRGTLQDTERLYLIIGNIYENQELLKD